MNIIRCNQCGEELDVKYRSRFNKIRIKTYLCHNCILNNKTRVCKKCFNKIIYQSPSLKRKADKLNSICKNCRSNQVPKLLTEQQEMFLNGLLLGDASIVYPNKKSSKYPRLTLARKDDDKDYLFWQYNIFKEFYGTGPKFLSVFDKRTGLFYNKYYLQTKTGEIFTTYHKMWYPNGNKIIPKNLKLSPLLLLIWFLDDGCIVKSSKNGLTIKLSTDGFIKADVVFLSKLLGNYLNAKFNVYKNGTGFIIKASTLPAIKFIKMIESVFPDCMQRKKTWADFDFNFVKNSNYFG